MAKGMERTSRFLIGLMVLLTLTGCGGGGGGGSSSGGGGNGSSGSPEISVTPASFNFGTVTLNNRAVLEITISNTGTADLVVSGIQLSNATLLDRDVNGGSNPCGSATPTIAAADSCTVQVGYQPTAAGAFSGNVQISSNDSGTPTVTLALSGTAAEISALSVKINQLENNCAGPSFTAYVSVVDQAGFPVSGLVAGDFDVTLAAGVGGFVVEFIGADETISVASAMDYSGTVFYTPGAIESMQNALIGFIDNLGANDEAEVIKFAELVEVVQAFTSDQALLRQNILAAWQEGTETLLYDAVVRAVADTSARASDRRAVIVMTDGRDTISTATLPEVITAAQQANVPIFTVGVALDLIVDPVEAAAARGALEDMANQTGGQFYEAATFDNLANIYAQLSAVLFANQYKITFTGPELSGAANLTVQATSGALTGDDTRAFAAACP